MHDEVSGMRSLNAEHIGRITASMFAKGQWRCEDYFAKVVCVKWLGMIEPVKRRGRNVEILRRSHVGRILTVGSSSCYLVYEHPDGTNVAWVQRGLWGMSNQSHSCAASALHVGPPHEQHILPQCKRYRLVQAEMSASTQLDSAYHDTPSALEPPPVPVSFGSGYVVKGDCTLEIRCHDRFFRDAVVCDENGDKLFAMEANLFTSWSVRRTLRDTAGHHVLDIRHYKTKLKEYIVEDPEGRELCIIKDGVQGKLTAVEVQVTAEKSNVTVSIRSFDHAGTKTVFEVEGVVIAEMVLTENNDVSFLHRRGLDRTVWRLRIVGGVDMALVLALAFCRAEISHAWRR